MENSKKHQVQKQKINFLNKVDSDYQMSNRQHNKENGAQFNNIKVNFSKQIQFGEDRTQHIQNKSKTSDNYQSNFQNSIQLSQKKYKNEEVHTISNSDYNLNKIVTFRGSNFQSNIDSHQKQNHELTDRNAYQNTFGNSVQNLQDCNAFDMPVQNEKASNKKNFILGSTSQKVIGLNEQRLVNGVQKNLSQSNIEVNFANQINMNNSGRHRQVMSSEYNAMNYNFTENQNGQTNLFDYFAANQFNCQGSNNGADSSIKFMPSGIDESQQPSSAFPKFLNENQTKELAYTGRQSSIVSYHRSNPSQPSHKSPKNVIVKCKEQSPNKISILQTSQNSRCSNRIINIQHPIQDNDQPEENENLQDQANEDYSQNISQYDMQQLKKQTCQIFENVNNCNVIETVYEEDEASSEVCQSLNEKNKNNHYYDCHQFTNDESVLIEDTVQYQKLIQNAYQSYQAQNNAMNQNLNTQPKAQQSLLGLQILQQSQKTENMSSKFQSEDFNEFGDPILQSRKKILCQEKNQQAQNNSSNINDFRKIVFKEDSFGPSYTSQNLSALKISQKSGNRILLSNFPTTLKNSEYKNKMFLQTQQNLNNQYQLYENQLQNTIPTDFLKRSYIKNINIFDQSDKLNIQQKEDEISQPPSPCTNDDAANINDESIISTQAPSLNINIKVSKNQTASEISGIRTCSQNNVTNSRIVNQQQLIEELINNGYNNDRSFQLKQSNQSFNNIKNDQMMKQNMQGIMCQTTESKTTEGELNVSENHIMVDTKSYRVTSTADNTGHNHKYPANKDVSQLSNILNQSQVKLNEFNYANNIERVCTTESTKNDLSEIHATIKESFSRLKNLYGTNINFQNQEELQASPSRIIKDNQQDAFNSLDQLQLQKFNDFQNNKTKFPSLHYLCKDHAKINQNLKKINISSACNLSFERKQYIQQNLNQQSFLTLENYTISFKIPNEREPKKVYKYSNIITSFSQPDNKIQMHIEILKYKIKKYSLDINLEMILNIFQELLTEYQQQLQNKPGFQSVLTFENNQEASMLNISTKNSQKSHCLIGKKQIHETLYRESEIQKERLNKKIQEQERIRIQNEIQECTFSPTPQRPGLGPIKISIKELVKVESQNNMNEQQKPAIIDICKDKAMTARDFNSDRFQFTSNSLTQNFSQKCQIQNNMQGDVSLRENLPQIALDSRKDSCESKRSFKSGGSLKFAMNQGQNNQARSPQKFYQDMLKFQFDKEEKLKQIREQMRIEAGKTQRVQRRCNSSEEQEIYCQNLSKEKLKKITNSKSSTNLQNKQNNIKINLFNSNTVQQQKRLKNDWKLNSNYNTNRMEAQNRLNINDKERYKSASERHISKFGLSKRRKSDIVEALYNDFFIRESKSKVKQIEFFKSEKENLFASKKNLKSNQILANKIALQAKILYDQLVQKTNEDFQESTRMKQSFKIQDNIIMEEMTGESGTHTISGCQNITNQLSDISTHQISKIDGITFEQFVLLMKNLRYLSRQMDDKQDCFEQQMIKNAWNLISFKQRQFINNQFQENELYLPLVVNLRNLIIFLLGIENIFIESMCCQEKQEKFIFGTLLDINMQPLKKQNRQIGFFIGQNYFLESEGDCQKLMQTFQSFIHNKLSFEREIKKLRTLKKLNNEEFSQTQCSIPLINKKSEQIVSSNGYKFGMSTYRKCSSPTKEGSQNCEKSLRSFQTNVQKQEQKQIFKMDGENRIEPQKLRLGCKKQDFIQSRVMNINSNSTMDQLMKMQNKLNQQYIPKSNLNCNSKYLTRTMTESNLKQSCDPQNKKSVFENLYQIAQKRKEKSEDGKRSALNKEQENIKQLCTFKPNLKKTKNFNSKLKIKYKGFYNQDLVSP